MLRNIVLLKEQMLTRLTQIDVLVDQNSYEKIRDKYLDSFGKDDIIKVYDEINQTLADCPIMVD